MKIIADMMGDYPDGVPAHLKLEQFSDENYNDVLFYGYHSVENKFLQSEYRFSKRKVLLNLWTPTEFLNPGDSLGRNSIQQPEFFDEIYTICPHTVRWHREHLGDKRYKYIFHPFDGSNIPNSFEKSADVCYFGGLHGEFHERMANVLSEFDYRVISMQPHRLVTHLNVPHKSKFDLVAQTKISVCYNLLPLTKPRADRLCGYDKYKLNEAFARISTLEMPQYKCRAAEAAFCKSLLLVKRDPWNLIEDYFVPNEEFLYFEDEDDLREKIKTVLENYDSYSDMIERAYKRSLNYTSQPLVEIIKNKKEWETIND